MREDVLHWAEGLPTPLAIVLIATLPVFELRGVIPFAYSPLAGGYGQAHPVLTYLFAVLGNMLPVVPILTLLGPAERALRRFPLLDRFFTWLFDRTERRSALIRRYQALGLILFVAIPAPMTGAWTGSIAAYLFKLPLRFALPCIILGVGVAGLVVTLASMGVLRLWGQ